MDPLLQDLRYALRKLRTAPGFTLAAVACIAVGVGANTAVFSLVNELLYRPVPGVSDPGRLVDVGQSRNGRGSDSFGWMTFADLRERSRTLALTAWRMSPLALGRGESPELVLGAQVSHDYFGVMGVSPALGRFFAPEEATPEAGAAVAVIGHRLWRERFDGDPSVVGAEVTVNGTTTTVVGVAPEGFRGNVGPLRMEAWVPFGMRAAGMLGSDVMLERRASMLQVSGRLLPGVSLQEAQADLDAVMVALVEAYPEAMEGRGAVVAPSSGLPGGVRPILGPFMGVLMVLVGLVLVVACVNVASMLLARGAARAREIAVRRSIGASRGRLVRQLLVETLTLFALGGAAGLLLATWLTALLVRLDPPTPPPFDVSFALALDARVLVFTLATVLLAAVTFGLGPAWRATSPQLVPALKNETGGSRRRSRGRSLLVGGQVALTVLLLVVSALFLRALAYAGNIGLGFDPAGVYTLGLNLELAGHDRDTGLVFWNELRQGLETVPGVEAFAATRLVPLGMPEVMGFGSVNAPGVEPPEGWRGFPADVNVVSGGYFDTLGMPLVAGRDLTPADDAAAPGVAVINETMARELWPGKPAVGQPFTLGERDLQVAGVVADSKYSTLSENTPWFLYLPLGQWYQGELNLVVRGDRGALTEVVALLARLEPRLPRPAVAPLGDQVEVATLPQTLAALVSGSLGLVGLLLAAIGVYGVTAYATAQRTREVGVRMALGARREQVEKLVLSQGMLAPLAGALVGALAAVPVAGLIRAYLLGVPALDPVSFGGALVTLLAAAALASWLPARRAARVDPVSALRSE